jgi:hypothetical protein
VLVKRGTVLILIFILLAACSDPMNDSASSAQNQTDLGSSIEDNSGKNLAENSFNIEEQTAISNQIQNLRFSPDNLRVVNSSQIDWPDTCLGIEQPGETCIREVTPGYWVMLEVDGLKFEYRADQSGKKLLAATPGLLWTRNGGGGYCDKLIIYLPDTVHVCWCENGEMKAITKDLLEIVSMEEYNQLIEGIKVFREDSIDQSTSGAFEPIIISLTIHGQGEMNPDPQEKQTFLTLAQDIFERIIP